MLRTLDVENGLVRDGRTLQAAIAEYRQLWSDTTNPGRQLSRWRQLLLTALRCSDIDALVPGGGPDQPDLAFTAGGRRYLVEIMLRKRQVSRSDVVLNRERVGRRPAGTFGIVISMSGFTDHAVALANEGPLSVLLLDKNHFEAMLAGLVPPDEMLTLLHDRAAFFGEAYTPLATLLRASSDPPKAVFGPPPQMGDGFITDSADGITGEIVFTLPTSNQLGLAVLDETSLLVTTQHGIVEVDTAARTTSWAVPISGCHRNPIVKDGAVLFTRRHGVGRYRDGKLTVLAGGLFGNTSLTPHPNGAVWVFANGDVSGDPGPPSPC